MSIQLAATGQQDVYISGKPSVTYFSSVYERHTPFLMQTYEVPFDNSRIITNMTSTCTIPSTGDIIDDITLKTTLPALNPPPDLTTFYWPTPSTNVYIYVDYGNYEMLSCGFGGTYVLTTPTTNTGNLNGTTGGKWGWGPNDNSGIFNGPYSNLLTINYNSSLQKFTISCPTNTVNFPRFYYLVAANGWWYQDGMLHPSSIKFLDKTSANFFGFDSINTFYPFVNGNVTSTTEIYKTGWVYGTGQVPNTNYYDDVGARLIAEARLTVGGQTISSIKGAYIDLMNDIDVSYENQVGLTQLMGKNDSITVAFPRTIYTKLNFGIKNLPICALDRHDVIVEIDFNPVLSSQLTTSNVLPSASLLVSYGFVSTLERDWFTKSKHTYVYDIVYSRDVQVYTGPNTFYIDGTLKTFIKEIYLIFSQSNTSYTYPSLLTQLSLFFNDQEYIKKEPTLFNTITLFESKITMPSRAMYMISFNKPINMTRINEVKLVVNSSANSQMTIYTKGLNTFVCQDGLGGFIFS